MVKERCDAVLAASDCLGMSCEIVRDAGMTFKVGKGDVLDALMGLGAFLDQDYREKECLGWLLA